MPKTPMTLRGADLLREELHRLRSVERPANSAAIADARAHGDLSENAEYHAARERAGFIEGRISELEAKLANAQVIDPKLVDAEGRCVFGATVDVQDENGESSTWQIVGEDEADIKEGRISFSSPIARALIGKVSGDEATLRSPKGERTLAAIARELALPPSFIATAETLDGLAIEDRKRALLGLLQQLDTLSPTFLPISALASGEDREMVPTFMSASCAPTMR